jgi:hypothetical protein
MPDSIKTTRICLIVAAGLEIATAALLLFIFFSGAALIGWGTERSGLLGSALLGATGILLAVLLLIAVPVGTVLGIFALKGLAGPDARAWFGSPNGARPAPNPPPTAV